MESEWTTSLADTRVRVAVSGWSVTDGPVFRLAP
ncbi:hypothetical protein SAZ_42190 [Streptomyces noursei ZPM]|nr:hypothetical protein SAZ_42190 [Streptomyces noursei ZPM]EPY92442.1 hypothetical protein K530_53215 [Streptomyces noursei CCRC 11814]